MLLFMKETLLKLYQKMSRNFAKKRMSLSQYCKARLSNIHTFILSLLSSTIQFFFFFFIRLISSSSEDLIRTVTKKKLDACIRKQCPLLKKKKIKEKSFEIEK